MGFNDVKEFISAPQIADIISYILILVVFILQSFIKKFVRKDNTQTLFNVDKKTEKIERLRVELNEGKEELRKERAAYETEKKRLAAEVLAVKGEWENMKRAIRLGFGNVDNLVKSGIANRIAKLLPMEANEDFTGDAAENTNNDGGEI